MYYPIGFHINFLYDVDEVCLDIKLKYTVLNSAWLVLSRISTRTYNISLGVGRKLAFGLDME